MGAFDLTIGTLLMGIFFNTFLYGLVFFQFLTYWSIKFRDPLWIRASVGALFVLDTTHSAIGLYNAWDMCVTNFTNPDQLLHLHWAVSFTAVATSVAAAITQSFLAHRVWKLTKNGVIAVILLAISFGGLISGCIAGIQSAIISDVTKFDAIEGVTTAWLSLQTAADLLTTCVLTIVLLRSRTAFSRTNNIINQLIRGAVQTGLFSSIFALADLFSFLFHRDTNLYAMFCYPIGRIYTNTLLDTLIARRRLMTQDANTQNATNGEIRFNTYRLQTNQSQPLRSVQMQKEFISESDTQTANDSQLKYKGDSKGTLEAEEGHEEV